MDADALIEFVRARGGVVRRSELIAQGLAPSAVRRACSTGLLAPLARGCYGLVGASVSALAAVRVNGALTCMSALHAMRLPLLSPPGAPHVVVPSGRGAPRPGLLPSGTRLHWGDVWDRGRPDLAQIVAHATKCLPVRDVVAAADAALAAGLLQEADLPAARRWARAPRFDAAVRLIDGRAGSVQESLARVALVEAGLDVVPQVAIPGVGRVDLLVAGRVVVETDGFAYHGDRAAFREDRRRDRALELRGYPVLRYAYEDAVFGTDRLVDEVRRLIELTADPTVRWSAVPAPVRRR